MIEIQSSDKNLSAKITQMTEQNVSVLNNFELHQGILYKVKMVYEQKAFRLCLPEFLGREIFTKLHYKSDAHVTNDNLRAIFNTSFYTHNSHKMVKQILQSCVICRLNRNVYKRNTSGEY